MKKLIDSTDLIKKEHLLMCDLINAFYYSGVFKQTVQYLSTGIGFGIDLGRFTFWSDLDEYDKTFYDQEFSGIEIELGSDSEILEYENLYYYFKVAGSRYIEKYPQDEQEIKKYLEEMKIKLKVDEGGL